MSAKQIVGEFSQSKNGRVLIVDDKDFGRTRIAVGDLVQAMDSDWTAQEEPFAVSAIGQPFVKSYGRKPKASRYLYLSAPVRRAAQAPIGPDDSGEDEIRDQQTPAGIDRQELG